MQTPLTHLPATEMAEKVKKGKLSPTEITEAHLDRIEKRNNRTNAFITVTKELAREMAVEAERAVESGEDLGPLHGVPIAIKDLVDISGVRTSAGSLMLEDHVAQRDSPIVEQLKSAGTIILGKTNTPEFGLGTTTDNRLIGPAMNPFDPTKVAGGSSGGSGAALGDFLVPLAHGTDAGGSIRIPASFCGVYGFKPTFGIVPDEKRPNAFITQLPFYDQGPMARSVEDAALMLDVMAGQSQRDPFSVPVQDNFRDATKNDIDELTVAYSPDMGIYPLDPAVEEVLDEAVGAFERAGATVEKIDPDLNFTQEDVLECFYTLATIHWESVLDELEELGYDPRGADRDKLRPYLRDLLLDGNEPTMSDYKRANVMRTKIFDEFQNLFSRYNLFVAGTLSITAFPLDEEPSSVDGASIESLRGWVMTQPFNLTGHPAASIPAGFIEGLPVGMQIVGRRHADGQVIAASAAFEREWPWINELIDSTS